jgi:hypothetical protein
MMQIQGQSAPLCYLWLETGFLYFLKNFAAAKLKRAESRKIAEK